MISSTYRPESRVTCCGGAGVIRGVRAGTCIYVCYKHVPTKHGPTKHGPTKHGPTKHGPTTHGPTKRDLTILGVGEHSG